MCGDRIKQKLNITYKIVSKAPTVDAVFQKFLCGFKL